MNEEKVCSKCGISKRLLDFYKAKTKDGYTSACRKCTVKQVNAREQKLLRTDSAYKAKYAQRKNNERNKRYETNPEYRERVLAQNRAKAQALKDRVFAAYGGYHCACPPCKETLSDFLTIDHIENDGAAHRRKIGKGGAPTYRWLVRHGFPVGFQVLCWNCNRSKHQNNGTCIHLLLEGSSTIPQGSTHEAIAWGSAGLHIAASGCYVDEEIARTLQ